MFIYREYSRTLIICIILFNLIFFSSTNNSEVNAQNEDILSAIDSHVENEMMKKYTLSPGISVGIIHGNETVYLKGYGRAAKDVPMTADTPLFLGSVSKSFTALAIMQLNESGMLNLDDYVQDYIPWFTTQNEAYAAQITVRHLLHHLTGFHKERDSTIDYSLEDMIRTAENEKHLGPPGSIYYYNNLNYQTLGYLVEVVSGQSYESYVQKHIFDPLDMTESYLSEAEAKENGLAQGHVIVFGIPIPVNLIHQKCWNPSSNIISSAEDLTHYMSALMNNGEYGNESILSPEGMKILWARYSQAEEVENYYVYAMGWNNFSFDGIQYIRHSGKSKNYLSEVIMTTNEGWGVVVLHNSFSELRALHQTDIGGWNIMRMLLDKPVAMEILPLRGFFILLDFIFLVMIIGLGIVPIFILRRKMKKQKESNAEISQKKIGNLVGIILSYSVFLFIIFPLTGILSEALSDHWYWLWNKDIWNVPDLASVFIVLALLYLVLGTYWLINFLTLLKKNEHENVSIDN